MQPYIFAHETYLAVLGHSGVKLKSSHYHSHTTYWYANF